MRAFISTLFAFVFAINFAFAGELQMAVSNGAAEDAVQLLVEKIELERQLMEKERKQLQEKINEHKPSVTVYCQPDPTLTRVLKKEYSKSKEYVSKKHDAVVQEASIAYQKTKVNAIKTKIVISDSYNKAKVSVKKFYNRVEVSFN